MDETRDMLFRQAMRLRFMADSISADMNSIMDAIGDEDKELPEDADIMLEELERNIEDAYDMCMSVAGNM